jgi:methionyl-tRNA formyltransferase
MRTVYLGTSDFAATVLERLARSAHRPALVVTRPNRPRGRGRKLSPPPVADAARGLGIDVIQPERVNGEEARELIAAVGPEIVCVCAYGALLTDPLLSEYEMLNVHPSLLPRWRGAAPVERAIEAGDEETGVTIMRPIVELDAGPMCLQRAEPIRPDDDYGSLAPRLAELSSELLLEALDGERTWRDQPDQGVTYAEKVGREDRLLDPALGADVLERRVRALNPHVGTYIERDGGERLGVRRAALAPLGAAERDGAPVADGDRRGGAGSAPAASEPLGAGLAPGELAERDGHLLLGTANGALDLLEVQPPGGRPMDAGAYLRGRAASL